MKLSTTHSLLHRRIICALMLLVLVVLSGCGQRSVITGIEPVPACISDSWPHELSDLSPDPAIRFGRLDNKLRYVLLKNSEPRDRVGLFLNIQSGSLHETEEQRGLAHFLEHMLFNGTTHYPPGTLINYFQSIGMGFGGDTNAHTGYDETVYKLILPSAGEEILDEGLLVLADYAGGALLLEEEVERERGIILAEKRARDTVGTRVRKRQRQFDFAGTLVAKRDPIGTEEVLKQADATLLRNFYSSWYRPENMVVVVVGDMDVEMVEALVKKHFRGLQAVGEPGKCPEMGRLKEEGTDVLYLYEPDLGYTSLSLGTVYNQPVHADTKSWEKQQLHAYTAASMLNNRLEKARRAEDSPFTAVKVYGGVFLQRYGYATLTANTGDESWKEGLVELKQILEQALEYGFSQREFERVKKEIAAYLEKQEQTASTRSSVAIASTIINKLNNNEVVLSPAQESALYIPMLNEMTLEDAEKALQRLWSGERRLVQVVGTAQVGTEGKSPEEYIASVLANGSGEPGINWQGEDEQSFPYLSLGHEKGMLVERRNHKDIGVESLTYEGGVRLNLKKTDFKKNQLAIAVHFGEGKMAEPRPGMAALAESVVRESGVGRMTREQLDEAFAGTNVNLRFSAGQESFAMTGGGLSNELELLLQFLYTRLHDPAFAESAYVTAIKRVDQMYDQMENTVEGRQQLNGNAFLFGNNPYFSMADRSRVKDISLEEISDWLAPVFREAPLEINVVGDIEPEVVKQLVARYFGGEDRAPLERIKHLKVDFPGGERFEEHVESPVEKALVTVAWKTDDFWDIARTRRFNVLASVIDDRLRVKIREELGATYSPVVYNHSSRTHKGFGIMRSQLIVAPEQAEELADIVREVVGGLAQEKIGRDELQRALEPTLTSIRDFQRTNGYWLNNVMALSSRHPQQLQWPLSIVGDFKSITPGELQQLAQQYLQDHEAAEVIITTGAVE